MTPEEFITYVMQSRGLESKRKAVFQAAALLCLSPTSVWQWLSGKQHPSRQSLGMIALIVENDELKTRQKPRRGKAAPGNTRSPETANHKRRLNRSESFIASRP